MKKTPVTMITGYLGSGKTTLMNELLKNQASKGMALIVNDMGSVNIDASILRDQGKTVEESKMLELTNGCICCTLQEEFMTQIANLSKDKKVNRILVEASGISNPAAIAEGFLIYQEEEKNPSYYLDSIVTVVDVDRICSEFLDEMEEMTKERGEEEPDIINLVMDQIEFCNVLILNKCDLRTAEEVEKVRKVIREFQRCADLIETIQGKVNPNRIFSGKKFDYEKVMNSSALQIALKREEKGEDACVDEYGISSFVYENIRPFHYEKFMNFVNEYYPKQITRAKGYVWFSDDDMHVQLFEQAGRNASVSEVSNWVAALPEEDQELMMEEYPEVKENWDPEFGDRINQIVFIGKDYDKEQIIQKLNQCIA